MIRKLGQVALPARDMERAIAFYRDVLELPFIWSGGNLAFFQLGDLRLLIEAPAIREFDYPGSVLYFEVEDIDAAVAHYQAKGVAFDDTPRHIGDLGDRALWMTFFRDPEGNLLALQCERALG